MNEEEMTPEQRQSVDNLAASKSAVSTADLASAGEQQNPQREAADQAGEEGEVGVRPRQESVEQTPVMSGDAAEEYRARWQQTQADFVDDPRSAVAAADALVAEVMKRVAKEFANERNGLERQWNEGGEASTEDLRVAFQRYRSFFSRLLNL